MTKVFINAEISERHIEKIRSGFPNVEVVPGPGKELPEGTEIVISWGDNFPSHWPEQPGLKWVHALTAGVDAFLVPGILEGRVRLTNSRGIHGIPMAEHCFAMMLSFNRGIAKFVRNQQQKKWDHNVTLTELHGKTLGIVGLGSIGMEIARLGSAFGMRVLGVKRTPGQPTEGVSRVVSYEGLDMVLKESDYIVLTVPLTQETRDLIGKRELELMNSHAVLINLARGEVVDEPALVTALETKEIAGAGLDVYCQEPLPAESPLWQLDNCLVSPHRAALSPHYVERAIDLFCRNLEAYLNDEPLPTQIDPSRGY